MPLFLLQAVTQPCVTAVWYKDPTIIIAVLKFVYVVVTALLWITTRNSVNITRDTFENSFMPIVAVPLLTPHNNTDSKEFAFTLTVFNYGSVPAVEVETSAEILADGIALSPKKHETGFLLIPPHSDIQTVFILVGDDYNRALNSASLTFRFSALYEGVAEKKYRYDYEGAYYPKQGNFVNTSAKSTHLGKPKPSRRPAVTH